MNRSNTADRGSPDPPRVYTTEQLGPKQSITPEGFLLCCDVPIARTGVMFYGDGETPVKVGDDGIARVERAAEELLCDDCIDSFNGKPVVDEHPAAGVVTPDNYQKLSKGTTLNARRGEGELSDCIVADLLITDAELIKSVRNGKREVSCGYEAGYEQTGPGRGRQFEIIGNHVALVERGRCGPRCAIGDRATQLEKAKMAKKRTRVNIGDAIKKTFLDAGESIAQLMTEEPDGNTDTDGDDDGHTHIHVHVNGEGGAAKPAAAAATDDDAEDGDDNSIEGRVSKLEAGQAKILAALEKLGGGTNDDAAGNGDDGGDDGSDTDEDPDMTGDSDNNGDDDKEVGKKQMTGDSAPLGTSYKQLAADCEILVPGFKVPTFDAKLNRKKTVDAMCSTRRRALDIAYHGADRELIEGVNGSVPNIAGMSCGALAVLFKGAVGAKKVLNNRAATGDGRPGQQSDAPAPTSLTLAEINAKNAEYWKSRGVRN